MFELTIHWYSLSEDFFDRSFAIRARVNRRSFSSQISFRRMFWNR
jgi:hypothetical protein